MNDNEQTLFTQLVDDIFNNQIKVDYKPQSAAADPFKYEFYDAFYETFNKTPDWWTKAHDHLLLEFGLKHNWDKSKYKMELNDGSNKQYYHRLLKNPHGDYAGLECPGYQEFAVWCNNWRNVQHRLRYLTYEICKYFNKCFPNIINIKLDGNSDIINQYDSQSFIFLNGYMRDTHIDNCRIRKKRLTNIIQKIKEIDKKKDELDKLITSQPTSQLKNKRHRRSISSHRGTRVRALTVPSTPSVHSRPINYSKIFEEAVYNTDLSTIRGNKPHLRIPTMLPSASNIVEQRYRDPFITRDLSYEFEQICQSFDLLEYGEPIAKFIIKLLTRKQLPALWNALGTILEYMPFAKSKYVLLDKREDLRHGSCKQLKVVCDKIINGSYFSVHIFLFLAQYMEKNADEDLARFTTWMKYSKLYESKAAEKVMDIESDHLLSVLMDIPLIYRGQSKDSILQTALEQHRSDFLNNDRVNGIMKHQWQYPSGLAPNIKIKGENRNYNYKCLAMLLNKPFHFYLTPMGFNATKNALHIIYVIIIYMFLSQRQYLNTEITKKEYFLWSMNLGYCSYELVECHSKGLRDYFKFAGWINYWDIIISLIWLLLITIRLCSLADGHLYYFEDDENPDTFQGRWLASQIYMFLWAFQAASLTGRSLVLFQTSAYFGVILRMMKTLMIEMLRFMFLVILLMIGFCFGFYYIEGGYNEHTIVIESWYEAFKFLFALTVGAGDFDTVDTTFVDQTSLQLYVILYIFLATILLMNLLIALLTTWYEMIHEKSKTESAFAFASAVWDLSHLTRFMPAPLTLHVFIITVIIHLLNFFPSILWHGFNVYNYINVMQYEGLYEWKLNRNVPGLTYCCNKAATDQESQEEKTEALEEKNKRIQKRRFFNCCEFNKFCKKDLWKCCGCKQKSENNVELTDNNEREDVYELTTRNRTIRYYLSTVFCCDSIRNHLMYYKFKMFHAGCYSCIPTRFGARQKIKDKNSCNGITLSEYANRFEKYHDYPLDLADTVLLKHLTVNTLFCKICYRPFDPKHVHEVLLTPFWALGELVSIYLFPFIVYIPLLIIYFILTMLEFVGNVLIDHKAELDVEDFDRQYFTKEALNINQRQQNIGHV